MVLMYTISSILHKELALSTPQSQTVTIICEIVEHQESQQKWETYLHSKGKKSMQVRPTVFTSMHPQLTIIDIEDVAAYFDSRFSSDEQIQDIYNFLKLKGHRYISYPKIRRFLGVIREYELQRIRFMMEYYAEFYCPKSSTTEEPDIEALLELVVNEELLNGMMRKEFVKDDEIVQNIGGVRDTIREFERGRKVGLNVGKET